MSTELNEKEKVENEEHASTMNAILKSWRLLDEIREDGKTLQVFDTGEGNIYLRVSDSEGRVIQLTFLGEI